MKEESCLLIMYLHCRGSCQHWLAVPQASCHQAAFHSDQHKPTPHSNQLYHSLCIHKGSITNKTHFCTVRSKSPMTEIYRHSVVDETTRHYVQARREGGEGEGRSFPGPETFGGPAIAQNTEKGVPDGFFLT